jgi:hypothetical protein
LSNQFAPSQAIKGVLLLLAELLILTETLAGGYAARMKVITSSWPSPHARLSGVAAHKGRFRT